MNPEEPKLIIFDDDYAQRMDPLALARLCAEIGAGELIVKAELPMREDSLLDQLTQDLKEKGSALAERMCQLHQPRRPTRARPRRRGEGLEAMMVRLGKTAWSNPTMKEQSVCANCDGAPDGGHTGELPCGQLLEDMGYQPNPYL